MKILKYILLVLLFVIKGILAYGTWYDSAGSGSWSDQTKWSPVGVPASGDQFRINVGHLITYTGNLTWTSGSMQIEGKLVVNGDLSLNSAATIELKGGGELTVTGSLYTNNNFVTAGILSVGQSLTVNNSFNNSGTVKVVGDVSINNSFTNDAGSVIDIDGNLSLLNGSLYANSGIIAVDGNLTKSNDVSAKGLLVVGGNYYSNGGNTWTSEGHFYVLGTSNCSGSECPNVGTSSQWAASGSPGSTYISNTPSWWTDHLANANSSSSSGNVCAGGSKSFSVSAVTVGAGNLSANRFEWAAYGGTISGASNTATIGGHTASVKTITGVDSNNKSSVTISWEGTAFSGAYVAVRQIPQDGCSDGKWSVLNVGFMPNASISLITGTSPLCVGETAPFTADAELAGGTGEWSSSDTSVASVNALSGLVTAVGYGTCNIIYTITGGCGGKQTAKQSLTVESPGDPVVFGSGQWNVYAYQGNNIGLSGITYKGYYTEPNFSFSTADRWGINGSPDEATGYQGCAVTNDNHTFVYKREGFPSGMYQITVGHDDSYQLYIDGALVGSSGAWDNRNPEVLTTFYTLNGTSKIEFRVAENGGESRGALTFTEVCTNPTNGGTIAGAQTICTGFDPVAFTSSEPALGQTGTLEYKWQYSTIDSPYSWQETGATGLIYDDNTALTADRWYRRLARVDCKTDWSGAAGSNVLKVTVTAVPTATISYSGSPFCTSVSTPQPVTISGTGAYTGGTYASTSGLTIDTSTGAISPGTSTAGTYMVTYTVAASGGCSVVTATTNVTIGDTTPPLITKCLTGETYGCVASVPAAITTIQGFIDAGGEVKDNCTAPNDLIMLHNDVIIPGVSCEVRRVYTITDASGNIASCTQLFSITDTEAPVINSVVDLQASPNDNSCGANLHVDAPTKVSENCSLIDEGAYYEYTLAGRKVTGHGSFDAIFPEGITLITWTISDLCGHVSAPKIQTVQVVFNLTDIFYDNGSNATSAGSGIQPMQTSTHEYFVDNKRPEDGYTYAWGLYVDNNGVPGAAVDGSTYSLTTVNPADVQITFKNTSLIPTGNYIISVIKTKTGIICKKPKTLSVTVLKNTFDTELKLFGNNCQSGETYTPSTILWEVNFVGNGVAPYSFGYAITLDGTPICSGTVSNITLTGTNPTHSSGCDTSNMPYVRVVKTATDSYKVRLEYTLSSITAHNFQVRIQISNATDRFTVIQIGTHNNSETLQLWGVPNTSAITTD